MDISHACDILGIVNWPFYLCHSLEEILWSTKWRNSSFWGFRHLLLSELRDCWMKRNPHPKISLWIYPSLVRYSGFLISMLDLQYNIAIAFQLLWFMIKNMHFSEASIANWWMVISFCQEALIVLFSILPSRIFFSKYLLRFSFELRRLNHLPISYTSILWHHICMLMEEVLVLEIQELNRVYGTV